MTELYQYYDPISLRASISEGDWTPLTIESAGALLKSCARGLLGLGMWSDQQNILELGISSFDVVRLANHLEDELKLPSSFDTTKLVESLLEQPLAQVAAYVCSAISIEPKSDSKLHVNSDDSVKKEEEYALPSVQKRTLVGLSEELLPKKLRKMESGTIVVDVSKEIRTFRRGQGFINGR